MYALPEAGCLTNEERLKNEFSKLFKEQQKKKKEEEGRERNAGPVKVNSGQKEIEKRFEILITELNKWERRREEAFQAEMKPLQVEASLTAWKRRPEIREKVVSLRGEEFIRNEKKIIAECQEWLMRTDIVKIEEKLPEVMELKREDLTLLQMAWEKQKVGVGVEHRRLTPDEYREKKLTEIAVKAKDQAEAKMALLKFEIDEKLKMLKTQKETSEMIDKIEELSEEQKEEMKLYAKEMAEALMRKTEGPVELM